MAQGVVAGLFRSSTAGVAAAVLWCAASSAHWATPTTAPVERLVTNIGAYVKEHPDNAHGHYLLARVHGLAFSFKRSWVNCRPGSKLGPEVPEVPDDDRSQGVNWDNGNYPAPTQAELIGHLRESVTEFQRAVNLKPLPLYRPGFAYVLEAGAEAAGDVDVLPAPPGRPVRAPTGKQRAQIEGLIKDLGDADDAVRAKAKDELAKSAKAAIMALFERRQDPDEQRREAVGQLLAQWWRDVSIEYYLLAFKATIRSEANLPEAPLSGLDSLVSYEAGKAFERLVKARGVRDDEEQKSLDAVQEGLKKLKALPPNSAITPMILSLSPSAGVGDLLAQDSTAMFDLDGDGRVERWPWVKPTTALLVWDPSGKGQIESGRQLFGSVTWWMFFENGYQALDALDDNRDGELAGKELVGLAAWFDRDGDGVSDRGEVVTLESLGIDGIATQALSMDGRCPANPAGLRMRDGRRLPTYDWVTEPSATPAD